MRIKSIEKNIKTIIFFQKLLHFSLNLRVNDKTKMNVLTYLEKHTINDLINRYKIKVKKYKKLLVLNYSNSSQEKEPIVQECRGLILSTDFEIVSRSFDRFFNYKEKYTKPLNYDEKCYAVEKIDGSLIKIYHFKNKWYISTRGTAFAENNVYKSKTITYKQAVLEALNATEEEFQKNCEQLNEKFTYICELTGKENKIITEYNPDKYELWLLGIRSNDLNGNYLNIKFENFNKMFKLPKFFEFNNIKECVEQAEHLQDLKEGFVVYDEHTYQPICKIKSPIYVQFHHIDSNSKDQKTILCKLIVKNEISEYNSYFKKYEKEINEYSKKIENHFNEIQKTFEILKKNMINDFDFEIFKKKSWGFIAIQSIKMKENILFNYFKSLNTEKQTKYIISNIIK